MNLGRNQKIFIMLVVVLVVVFCASTYIDARVGGGHKYSGSRSRSGGHSGGGGGGGGGAGLIFLIELALRHPKIGIPLLIIVAVIFFRSKMKNPTPDNMYSTLQTTPSQAAQPPMSREASIAALQQEDGNFSLPLFLDFAQLLYTDILQFAGKQKVSAMQVYLSPKVMQYLEIENQQVTDIRDIIIGKCDITHINLADPNENFITLAFETNYTVTTANNPAPVIYYENSSWTLARQKGVVSKGPGEMNKTGCTNCGGSLDDNREGVCPYCGHHLTAGTVTWYLKSFTVFEKSKRGPDITGGYAAEVGTSLPTRFQPDFQQKMAAFAEKYPDFDKAAFFERVKYIFISLQQAWSSQKWEMVRPFETDYLFQTHRYWIEMYKREHLRNMLEDIQINDIQLVKIQSDAFFDALTVRIYAAMKDYTQTYTGKITGGDPKELRFFSEYWTFIRKAGVQAKELKPEQCPNCGSPLKIGMVGKCEYCGSKITSGDFTWVLSQIEQDESYAG